MSKQQDTESLFKKKKSISIILLVFVVVTMVLRGVIYGVHHTNPGTSYSILHVSAIVYAACLLVFAIIGINKGKENRIMSFIFGICTLVLSALLIIDRIRLIVDTADYLEGDILGIPSDPINIFDVIMRFAMIALCALVIVFSILSIVNSVGIIKENVPSGGSTTTRPASSGFVGQQPIMTSTPPPVASSIPKSQFCASCGAPLDAGAAFCNKCGAKV